MSQNSGPSLMWHVAMERARYYAVTDGRRHEVLGWVYMVRKI